MLMGDTPRKGVCTIVVLSSTATNKTNKSLEIETICINKIVNTEFCLEGYLPRKEWNFESYRKMLIVPNYAGRAIKRRYKSQHWSESLKGRRRVSPFPSRSYARKREIIAEMRLSKLSSLGWYAAETLTDGQMKRMRSKHRVAITVALLPWHSVCVCQLEHCGWKAAFPPLVPSCPFGHLYRTHKLYTYFRTSWFGGRYCTRTQARKISLDGLFC